MNSVSVTVPNTAAALLRAAEFMIKLADDLDPDAVLGSDVFAGMQVRHEPDNTNTGDAIDLSEVVARAEAAPAGDTPEPEAPEVVVATEAPDVEKSYMIEGAEFTETELREVGYTDQHLAELAPINSDAADAFAAEIETDDEPTTEQLDTLVVDSAGLPWDARIHSSGKTRLKGDDTWKLIRGIDKDLVEQVRAEHRRILGLAEPEPKTTAAPPPPATTAAAPPPPATTTAAAPPPPAASGALTLPGLIQKITQAAIPADKVTAILSNHGIGSLPLLATQIDKLQVVHDDLFPGGQ